MPAKDPRYYLIHINDCCKKILSYTRDLGKECPVRVDLGGRRIINIEIIGEAAAKVDPDFRLAHGALGSSREHAARYLVHGTGVSASIEKAREQPSVPGLRLISANAVSWSGG